MTVPLSPQSLSLEGLRKAVLTPRPLARDENGMIYHPAISTFDEGVDTSTFLAAFGIESSWVELENDDPKLFSRWVDSQDSNCSEWTPSRPAGDDWLLAEIYMAEDGPVALYVREKNSAPRSEQATDELTPNAQTVERIEMAFLQRLLARAWQVDIKWHREPNEIRRIVLDLRDSTTIAPALVGSRVKLIQEFVQTARGAFPSIPSDPS